MKDSELHTAFLKIYPYMNPDVRFYRPFWEGALAFHVTGGRRDCVQHGYRKDGYYAQDWNLGWKRAKIYKQPQFKFLRKVA